MSFVIHSKGEICPFNYLLDSSHILC